MTAYEFFHYHLINDKSKERAVIYIYIYIYLSIYRRFWAFEVELYSVNCADYFFESDFSSSACMELADGIKIG